jgi:hypothetical protein
MSLRINRITKVNTDQTEIASLATAQPSYLVNYKWNTKTSDNCYFFVDQPISSMAVNAAFKQISDTEIICLTTGTYSISFSDTFPYYQQLYCSCKTTYYSNNKPPTTSCSYAISPGTHYNPNYGAQLIFNNNGKVDYYSVINNSLLIISGTIIKMQVQNYGTNRNISANLIFTYVSS